MKNPFSPDAQGVMKLNRNVYDLGRNSVFTTDFFKLYPFFLQEVIPGDSVQLDAQVGIRGMPTVFPVQTRCRISMEYYYVRNRTLMDNFEDFIFKTKDVEHPWLRLNDERAKEMISIGSLGDAFNVPSSLAVGADISSIIPLSYGGIGYDDLFITKTPFTIEDLQVLCPVYTEFNLTTQIRRRWYGVGFISDLITVPLISNIESAPFKSTYIESFDEPDDICVVILDENNYSVTLPALISVSTRLDRSGNNIVTYSLPSELVDLFNENYFGVRGNSYKLCIMSFKRNSGDYIEGREVVDNGPFFPITPSSNSFVPSSLSIKSVSADIYDATDDLVIKTNPFVGNNPRIRLNALPFRAYEQVCNYYYRNDKNNPYILDGEAQYNEFIPTHGDGPDDNIYDFHYRNWELDRFTSAVQSPQFGEAPLVGLTYSPTADTATLEFEATDASETRSYSVKVGVDGDGKIDSIVDFDKDIPSANLRRLSDSINAGISINDFRITNSFQRFLENVLRRGPRYRNQLKSHFGTSVDYPDIDVPQYIGGASSYLDSGQVTNMADSPNAGLGDYVGTLQGGLSTRNKIHCYCPEHGWIIGIISISPIPSYPQSINKSLIKSDAFDYFLPEFGKIGYVPIHYSELMPLQTGEGQSVDDVFGYQKAWYDYMQAMDEVHGDFRTTLRDFVLTRTFKERPQLSESFTVGSPEQLNDIFVTNNIADKYGSSAKFMCSSHVSCIMKRPIPMIGTPSLE